MIALISPAKNLDFSNTRIGLKTSMPHFLEESEYLMTKLKKLSARQLGKMMKINPELSDLNYERNQEWVKGSNPERLKTAIHAFNGEVYRGLNAGGFSKDELAYANDHLRILSGLYGLLKPLDLIEPYRLEMGTSWKITGKITNLYKFWNGKIREKLEEELQGEDEKVLVNIASQEYWKAVDAKSFQYRVVECLFLDWKNGEYKSVMTWAKHARGLLAREMIVHKLKKSKDLKNLSFGGYSFNQSMSSDDQFVYTRKN